MASSYEPPNPLRPYYIPPSIGPPPNVPNSTSTNIPKTTATQSSFRFPDLDYSDYIPESSPSTAETLRELVDKAVWKYTSVLIAQPFEVAKTVLQVYVPQEDESVGAVVPEERITPQRTSSYRDEYDNSSDDEPNYFSSSAPTSGNSPPRGRAGRPPRHITDRDGYIPPSTTSPHTLALKNNHSLLDVLSSLSSESGAFALWKGTNATFVCTVLARTAETFFRSLISAALGLPDSDLPSISSSTIPTPDILAVAFPFATLLVTTAASGLSALLVSPIDTARTRLILTPSSHSPRSLLAIVRTLPSPYLIPSHLIPITTIHSVLPSLLATATPLLLKTYLSLDPILTPTTWSIATFVSSALDLVIRLPLETILRRAQIATFTSPALRSRSTGRKPYTSTNPPPKCETIVPVQQNFRGIFNTAWSIVHEEGYSVSTKAGVAAAAQAKEIDAKRARRKGQGVEGLYRGWRVGMWGLVGVWGAGYMGGMAAMGTESAGGEGVGGSHGGKF